VVIGEDGKPITPGGADTGSTTGGQGDGGEPGPGSIKYVLGNVTVHVVAERVQYGPEGKLITESLKDYTRQPYARTTHPLMTSCAAGTRPSVRPPSYANWKSMACCLIRWPKKLASISTPST
jgi:hypothetical protein